MIREGFWRSTYEQELPMPVACDDPWAGQDVFIDQLEAVEASSETISYRGWSTCRICGCSNGSREYQAPGATWPEGLKHYITDHNVVPSQAFVDYISSVIKEE